MRTSVAIMVSAVLVATASHAQTASRPSRDYPQWRGQTRDGSASAFIAPKVWPEHLTRRWIVDVGGGYATLISGRRIFVKDARSLALWIY
jgi:hypothetical protein